MWKTNIVEERLKSYCWTIISRSVEQVSMATTDCLYAAIREESRRTHKTTSTNVKTLHEQQQLNKSGQLSEFITWAKNFRKIIIFQTKILSFPRWLFSTWTTASATKCALKMYSEENTLVAIGEKKAAHNIWMYETWTFLLEVMNWACWVRSVNFTQALVKAMGPGPWRTGQL